MRVSKVRGVIDTRSICVQDSVWRKRVLRVILGPNHSNEMTSFLPLFS